MAIDTATKRRSAVATRRLPWFRRFLPAPDGTISAGDRQQLAFVYQGISAGAPVITIPSITFDLPPRSFCFDLPPRSFVFDQQDR